MCIYADGNMIPLVYIYCLCVLEKESLSFVDFDESKMNLQMKI